MKKQTLIAAASLAAIIGAVGWLSLNLSDRKLDVDIYSALGSVTAEETAKLLGDKGQVVLISWGSNQRMPVADAQINSFSATIKKHSGIRIVASERVNLNPSQMMASGGAIAPDELLRIVNSHPDASAIVLFLAFPEIPPDTLKTDGKVPPRFVVVSGYNPGYRHLLTDHVIQLAIVSRNDRSEDQPTPQTVREQFDQNYRVITSDEAVALPY